MEWLMPFALLALLAGSALQIAEEWRSRGLTDTSYVSLLCTAAGSAMMIPIVLTMPSKYCAFGTLAIVVAMAGIIGAVVGIGLKAKDDLANILAALRRRG
ncbi:MAG TPA: hypothetical protein VNK46_00315 [Nitrospiraceae bacterium]|nr:hypothetical protein [Nitrospiraceae bacterium]